VLIDVSVVPANATAAMGLDGEHEVIIMAGALQNEEQGTVDPLGLGAPDLDVPAPDTPEMAAVPIKKERSSGFGWGGFGERDGWECLNLSG